MNITIDTPQMRELISEAILSSLDTAKRDELMRGAIWYLLNKSPEYYGGRKTPMQAMFESAVTHVANDIILEHVKSDTGLVVALKSLIEEATAKAVGEKRDVLVEKLTSTMVNNLLADR